MALNRDEILGKADIKREQVEAWGGEVWVKGLTGAERDKWEGSIVVMHGKDQTVNFSNIRAKLCAMTICDADGKRLFTDNDVVFLSEKAADELQKVFVVAQRLSGLSDDAVKELSEGVKTPFGDSASA